MAARTCPYHGGHIHLCQAYGPDELANNYYLRKKLALGGWRKENLIQSVYCSDTASSSATSSYYPIRPIRSQGAGARYICQRENPRRCHSVLPEDEELCEEVMQDVEAHALDDNEGLNGMD